ncbi:MAG: hypothetical protein ACTTKL_10870 [Treponema sp.]
MRRRTQTFRQQPALFSYRKGDSAVHRLPPLLKLTILCVICVRTFSNSVYGGVLSRLCSDGTVLWLRAAFYFCVQASLFFAARTPFSSLKKLKFVFVLGGMLTALRLIPSRIEPPNYIALDAAELFASLLYVFRFFVTSAAALIIFETTSRIEIFDAFSSVEKRLAALIPAVKKLNIALTLSITVSFIPEIFSAWNAISLAAAARSGSARRSPQAFFRSVTAQFFALFYNMFDYAEQLRKASANRLRPAENRV